LLKVHPAQLGQEDAGVALVDPELLGSGVAEGIVPALALEARCSGAAGEEVRAGPLQVLERLLQRMDGRVAEPGRLGTVAPERELPAQFDAAQFLLAQLMAPLLQGQRPVEDEAAGSCGASHVALLLDGRQRCVLEGLQSQHGEPCTNSHARWNPLPAWQAGRVVRRVQCSAWQPANSCRDGEGPPSRARALDHDMNDEACRATGQQPAIRPLVKPRTAPRSS
jgi:hypothetical protein